MDALELKKRCLWPWSLDGAKGGVVVRDASHARVGVLVGVRPAVGLSADPIQPVHAKLPAACGKPLYAA